MLNHFRLSEASMHIKSSNQSITYSRDELLHLLRSAKKLAMDRSFFGKLKALNLLQFSGKKAGKLKIPPWFRYENFIPDEGNYANNSSTTLWPNISTISPEQSISRNTIPVRITTPANRKRNYCVYNKGVQTSNLINIKFADTGRTLQNNNTSIAGPKLKVAHLNIQSMKNREHLIQARQLVADKDLDVLTISETWFNSTVTNTEVELQGYKLLPLDRLHKTGGGVCAYLKNNIKGTVTKHLTRISESGLQQLWIQMQHRKTKSIIICVCYRPPDCPLSSFDDELIPNYAEALTFAKPIVLLDDMNYNLLENGYDRRALDDFSNCLNLSQLISEPTKITDTSTSLLDVILVTDKHLVVESGVVNVCISDHSLVFCTLSLKVPKPSPHNICVRSYKNYNPDLFSSSVSELALFVKVCDIDDVNLKLAMFDDAFLTNLNTYAPIKSVKIRNRSMAFVKKEIKDTMRTRDQLRERFRLTRDIADWNSYRNARNDVKTKIKQAEFEYVQQEINRDKGNTGSMWKVIRKHIKLCFVVLKAWVEKQYKLNNLVSLSAGLGQRQSINKQNGGLGYLVFGCPLTSFVLRKLGLFEFIFLNN